MKRFAGLAAAAGLLCLGIVVGAAFNSVAWAQEKVVAPTAQKWEYKVVNKHLDEKNLNELGEDGGEFVFYHGNGGPVYEIYKRPTR